MTRPFQYDNFVQSQIAVGTSQNNPGFGSNIYSNHRLDTSNGNQSRLSLKQKINQLLGLCKEQNEGIKNQFAKVIGAEKEILDLMKEQLDQPPSFNNYARSNVEMFPGPNYGAPAYSNYGSDFQPRMRSYQSFPVYNSGQGGANYGAYSPEMHHQSKINGYYQNNLGSQDNFAPNISNPDYVYSPYHNIGSQSNFQQFGNNSGRLPNQQQYNNIPGENYQNNYFGLPPNSTYPTSQPNHNENHYYQGPRQGQVSQNYQRANQRNPNFRQQDQNQDQDPYVTDYHGAPHDPANILKSKVLQLKQENLRLKNLAHQSQGHPIGQQYDQEAYQLQQQIARLRNVVQDYENQVNIMNGPRSAKKVQLLRQLKQQGQKIRQDTLSLLRNKSAPSQGFYQTQGGYGGAPEFIASQRRGLQGLSYEQQAQLRAQLNQLKAECDQLHNENANIKRISKGTNFTEGRRY